MILIACGLLLLAPVAYVPAATADELSKQQIYANFKAAYSAGEWQTASDWAARLVEEKQAEFGADSPQLIVSLINLASVQIELMDWDGAGTSASRARTILDAQPEDNIAQRMVVMTTLAKAQLGLRDEDLARATINAGLTLSKQQEPPDKWHEAEFYSLLVEIALREQHIRSGNQASAKSLEARAEFLGEDSVDLVPYIEEAADWYRFSTQLPRERKLHLRSIDLVEGEYGSRSAQLANLLRDVAATYVIERKSPKKALAALERAAILDYPESAGAALLQAKVQADLGDYHVVFGDPQQGIPAYRLAWQKMAAHEGLGEAYARNFFANSKRLYYNQPDAPANTSKGADYFAEGFVLTQFTVRSDGTLADIEIVDSQPIEMKQQLFFKALRQARFRPRLVDGEPVDTPMVQFRNTYSYVRR